MAIKAVIWDVDGTLLSTRRLYPEAYRKALAPYVGREMTNEELFTMAIHSHSELRFLRAHAGDEHYDASLKDFHRLYQELHETHFDGVYEGIPETIEAIRKRGLKQGVVTGKSRGSFDISIVVAGLGPFDVLVMDDDVSQPKPHPEGILAAIDALNVRPQDAIYVGDSPTDIEAAHAAAVKAAAALWSKPNDQRAAMIERIKKAGGAILLDTPPALLNLL